MSDNMAVVAPSSSTIFVQSLIIFWIFSHNGLSFLKPSCAKSFMPEKNMGKDEKVGLAS